MKMHRNPVLAKELKIGARSIKLTAALTAYTLFIAALTLWRVFATTRSFSMFAEVFDFTKVVGLFSSLATVQMVMICLIVPIITATAIAGERERQTLDLMLVTPLSPSRIIAGKLLSALLYVLLFVMCSLPSAAVSFLYGGIQWRYLIVFLIGILALALFDAAIGLWCSCMFRRTIVAVIMTLLLESLFFVGTLLCFTVVLGLRTGGFFIAYPGETVRMGWLPLLLLLNPALTFVNAIDAAYQETALVERMFLGETGFDMSVAEPLLQMAKNWTWWGIAATLVITVVFVLLAAKRLDASRGREKPGRYRHGPK